MLYITLLDQFHPGIYKSQVIDVCKFLSENGDKKVQLVPFLSIREILRSDNAKQIKKLYPNSRVLPAFPGLGNYRLTAIFLAIYCLVSGEREVIARNAFAASIALKVRRWGLIKKVVIDVRSSLTAEIEEYDSFPNPLLRRAIAQTERDVVMESDFRMAVSQKMIAYWEEKYGYSSTQHVVIPCTLNREVFEKHAFDEQKIRSKRQELGYSDEDIVLIFSGSNAPWQGEDLKQKVLSHYLKKAHHHVLFLSKSNELTESLAAKHPGKVKRLWLSHEEVPDYLQAGDYGLLLREQSDTNRVASPAKFAEYLAAGLKVLISENLGDFSELVKSENIGFVVDGSKTLPELKVSDKKEKSHILELAKAKFTKENYSSAYEGILEAVS